MSSETGEIASLRHEEMTTKHEADGISHTIPGINRIKTEPSGVDSDKETVKTMGEEQSLTSAGNVEQVFIKKEDPEETVSNSIKSEIDWDKCIAEDQSILDMEAENYKLDMEMRSQIKEELKIKEEWDEDPDEVCEVSASRIKKEYSEADSLGKGAVGGVIKEEDMEEEEYKLITEDCDIKSESDTSMDATSEVPSNSMAKCIILRNEDSKSFSCYNCDYSAYSEGDLINHLKEHGNEAYMHIFKPSIDKIHACTLCISSFKSKRTLDAHIKRKHLAVSSEDHKLNTCIYCDTKFKDKRTLHDHVAKKHPNFIETITSKIYVCTICEYSTTYKTNFDRHITRHPENAASNKLACILCDAIFKSKVSLDDHVLKRHPDLKASVTSKIFDCTECTYKTTIKCLINRHMSVHHKIGSFHKARTCSHCNAKFFSKQAMDDHVLKKHPSFSASVLSQVYECKICRYKTTIRNNFIRHIPIHSELGTRDKLTCIHCNATFGRGSTLDDHVVRKHPDFITSVTRKIYECANCSYRTTEKSKLIRHMSIHNESGSNRDQATCIYCNTTFASKPSLLGHVLKNHSDFYKTTVKSEFGKQSKTCSSNKQITCMHCNTLFKSQRALEDHLVKKHPGFTEAIDRKIYGCIECGFKTVLKNSFSRHMSIHSESGSSYKDIPCLHCNATFKSKRSVDDHVVKNHPNFIDSVTHKIFECKKCTYKTVVKNIFLRHISTHSEPSSKYNCIHCNATFRSKGPLDDHVLKKHPDFMRSIGRKIYQCTKCIYKTTVNSKFRRHLSIHNK